MPGAVWRRYSGWYQRACSWFEIWTRRARWSCHYIPDSSNPTAPQLMFSLYDISLKSLEETQPHGFSNPVQHRVVAISFQPWKFVVLNQPCMWGHPSLESILVRSIRSWFRIQSWFRMTLQILVPNKFIKSRFQMILVPGSFYLILTYCLVISVACLFSNWFFDNQIGSCVRCLLKNAVSWGFLIGHLYSHWYFINFIIIDISIDIS